MKKINDTKSLTASEVALAVTRSASKGTVNIFKAIAYLTTTASIVVAVIFMWFMFNLTNTDVPYGVIDIDCTRGQVCWEEQEILIDKHKRRIGDLSLWGDYATEFENNLPAALNGDIESQIFIALLYANGEGVHQDYDRALEWICKAARNGNLEAGKLYSKISIASISDDYEPRQCNDN